MAKAAETDETILIQQIEDLYLLVRAMNLTGVVAKLQEMVPEYRPVESFLPPPSPRLTLVK
ncbi:MAG: hypothetical protein P8X63_15690 [Desulfuromonadaceae bacterium]